MSSRDKKIALAIGPVLVLVAFWVLLLGPKRAEVSKLGGEVATAQQERDTAANAAAKLQGSRRNYAEDYETVVRLGKAVPSSLDMPSLLVQLDSAAKGTGIDFQSVKAGERSNAPAAGAAAANNPGGSGSSQPPVAAGGEKAQTGAGQSAEKANNASAQSDQANSAATQQPAEGGGTPSGSANGASAPSGSSTPPANGSSTSGVAGLDRVPLDFTFTGSYFDLADFFHRMKRFVRVANEDIKVRGRLMTIDNLDFTSTEFPTISATVKATVYLTPTSEGTTAGGTPAGPQGTTPTPAGTSPSPAASGTPAAPASSTSPTGGAQ